LDIVWIAVLCKITKKQPIAGSGSSQIGSSGLGLPNPESLEQSALVPEIEEINNTDFFSHLPEEIILITFSFLNAIQQAKCGAVSRRWRRLASDETLLAAFNPRNLSPLLKVFDESDWVTHVDLSAYGLTTEDIPPLDPRKATTLLERILSSPLMTKIEENAGITLLTIPKGLTFNTLVKFVESIKMENKPKFTEIWNLFSSKLGDIPIDKTYRIVITNNIFKKSRNKSFTKQKDLVVKNGCEIPKALEATVLLIVTFLNSSNRLYNDNPWTFTRCSDDIVADYPVVVGGFSHDGLRVTFAFDNEFNGVGGVLRRF
jgi:hypothetical protein